MTVSAALTTVAPILERHRRVHGDRNQIALHAVTLNLQRLSALDPQNGLARLGRESVGLGCSKPGDCPFSGATFAGPPNDNPIVHIDHSAREHELPRAGKRSQFASHVKAPSPGRVRHTPSVLSNAQK